MESGKTSLTLNGNAAHSRTNKLIAIQRDNLGVSWAVVLDRLLTKVLTVFLQFGGSSTAEPTKSNSSCDVSDSSSNSTHSNVHNHFGPTPRPLELWPQ